MYLHSNAFKSVEDILCMLIHKMLQKPFVKTATCGPSLYRKTDAS